MPHALNRIQRGFSESAGQYDLSSALHREIADKLWAQVSKESVPSALLDVGCGTGYLTGKAKKHFPQAQIIGLDFAQGMLNAARAKHQDIIWVLGDGNNLPFADESFDILISNLAYQWASDLTRAFGEARRVLSPNGVLACTLFGFNTCQELFQSLDETKKGSLQFTRLPNESHIKQALASSGFKKPVIDCEQIKLEFSDMQALIMWLKSIGANNLPREGYVGRDAMSRAAAIYRERFSCHNGIQATFEVIRVYVKK